jgi:hypothetical protein
MNRNLFTAVALVTAPLLWAAAANADVITTGGSAGTVSFTKLASGGVSFTTAGFTTNPAAFQSPNGTTLITGTTTFGAMAGTTGAENAMGVFPITPAVTESFTFTAVTGATGSMTGTITWPGIKDGTNTPSFDVNAAFTVTSDTVTNPIFLADFPVGGSGQPDFTLNFAVGTTLTGLATGASTTGAYSSGELIPTPSRVPEPASLTLLGSAFIGLGWLARRKKKAA